MSEKQASAKTLRLAVIGCGAIGKLHAQAVRQSSHAELTAACDVELLRAKAITANAYNNVAKLLAVENLNAVTVATPDHLHVEPVMKALSAGCHVFCEKPLASTAKEAQRLVNAARRHDVFLAVDYNRRFGFGYQTAKQLIESGRMGKITHAVIHVTDGFPPAPVASRPFALLKSLLVHHIDLMRWLCGEVADGQALFGPRNESVVLSLRFDAGSVGTIVGGWRKGQTRTVEMMEIGGTKGVVRIEDVMGEVTLWTDDPDKVQHLRLNYFKGHHDFYDTVIAHVQSFLERVARGQKPLVTGEDGLRGLEIIEAASCD